MLEKNVYVERILIVLNPDGTLKGAQQEILETITEDGSILRAAYLDAEPLEDTSLQSIVLQSGSLEQVSRLTDEVGALRADLSTERASVSDLTDELAAERQAYSVESARLEGIIATATDERDNARAIIADKTSELAQLSDNILALQTQDAALRQREIDLLDELAVLRAENTTLQSANEDMRARLDAIDAANVPPEDVVSYANWKRRLVAYGGTPLQPGVVVDTSPEGQAMLTGVIESIERGYVTEPIDFKTGAGWMKLDLTTLHLVATAVSRHVQASFSAQSAIDAKIASGEIRTIADVDAFPWPPNS